MQIDDRTLVERAQRCDPEAFGKLYECYADRVYGYILLKIGDATEAEDLTEQVFLRALENINSFSWRGVPFIAWLFRIARNQVIDYIRARKTTLPLETAVTLSCSEPGPEEMLELNISRKELVWAVSQLTEAQQQVIALKFAGGLRNAEAAQVMNKSEGAIKALQHSAIAALRRIYIRNGMLQSPGALNYADNRSL